ncbi:nitrogenase component 1 [Anaerolentibacter hominis]|uniref:nitrogenase component 1 n=1 Tax=Anaerolentibacter hominis TaxID=3079009 RepID=UPI0031B7F58E
MNTSSGYRLKKLSEIQSYSHIVSPSAAIRRGMHCPLFGCTLLMQQLEHTAVIIMGTEECGFYSKEILKVVNPEHYMEAPVYCFTLEESDIIFGCEKQLLSLIEEIEKKDSPEIIYLVSTCVTALIGEDMKGLIRKAGFLTQAAVFCVEADNFRQNSHVDGMSDMTAALAGRMAACSEDHLGVNLLGIREEDWRSAELGRYLARRGIPVRAVLPGEASLNALKEAPKAALNLVLDSIGLKLAKNMEALGIPYQVFGKYADPDRIKAAYQNLEQRLQLEPDEEIDRAAVHTKRVWEKLRHLPAPMRRIIYTNSPLITFDTCLLLHRLDFEILACFTISYNDFDRELFEECKASGMNPYMALLTDFGMTESLCGQLKPGCYVGRGYKNRLDAMGIRMISPEGFPKETGFALSAAMAEYFYESCTDERRDCDGSLPLSSDSQ